jgi:DNA-binding beta-propeller fold protein YncE
MRRERPRSGMVAVLFATAVVWLLMASAASAADSVYWSNLAGGGSISFAALDGSGGSNVNTTGASSGSFDGVTIDAVAGRIYWSNAGANKISFANLDGSGGGDLNTTGATTASPDGVAIDPAGGRIYWANYSASMPGISFARLDGSGGGNLNTSGATTNSANGVALDLAAGRIYWANQGVPKISFARLDGTGGGDLNTSGATVAGAIGVAIDSDAGRIYWPNIGGGGTISFARLDGSGGGGTISTAGATMNTPIGVAIDPAAGRIYWANAAAVNKISFARLDGSGGGDLNTAGATTNDSRFPALLETPAAAAVPTVTGGAKPGSVLTCSGGAWAPDLLGSLLYRAPQSVALQWISGGQDVAGATASTFTASSVGEYSCRATAQNHAGSASQTSLTLGVFGLGKAKLNKKKGTALLPVTVPGPGTLRLTGKGVVKQRTSGISGSAAKTVSKAGTVKLKVKPKGKTRKKLKKKGMAKVKLTITFKPTGGTAGVQAKSLKLRQR